MSLREVADALDGLPGVVGTDLPEDDDRTDGPLLEITVGPEYDRVPPRVLRKLGKHDVGIYSSTPRGEYHTVLAV